MYVYVYLCGLGQQSIHQLTIDWTVQGLNPSGEQDFVHLFRPTLGPIKTPVKWVLGFFAKGKATRVWH